MGAICLSLGTEGESCSSALRQTCSSRAGPPEGELWVLDAAPWGHLMPIWHLWQVLLDLHATLAFLSTELPSQGTQCSQTGPVVPPWEAAPGGSTLCDKRLGGTATKGPLPTPRPRPQPRPGPPPHPTPGAQLSLHQGLHSVLESE